MIPQTTSVVKTRANDKSESVSPVFGKFPGFIRGNLPTPILRELLSGNLSLRSALEAGGNRPDYRVHYSRVPAGTLEASSRSRSIRVRLSPLGFRLPAPWSRQ